MNKGDIGSPLIFTIRDDDTNEIIDLTNATSATLIMSYRGTRAEKICTILVPKTDGKVQYTIADGDLPVSAPYKLQVRIAFNDGAILHSNIVELNVGESL